MSMVAVTKDRAFVRPVESSRLRWKTVVATLALLIATAVAYHPVRYHPFFGVDDNFYLTTNPHVLGPLNWGEVQWAFTHQYCLNYDPITFLAHSIDARLFGLNPVKHHEVNIAWHLLNAVLLLLVLKRYTGYPWRSFMVAALFALHPTAVENVAWVVELKTLLSTAFFFLAIGAYQEYAVNPKRGRMAVVASLYLLGLLAKPQIITLPFVLLLLDYWPLRRMFAGDPAAAQGVTGAAGVPASVGRLLGEKAPLFVIAAADAMVTVIAEHKAKPAAWPYTFSIRLGNAILSYSRYLAKAFWPVHLSYLYPHPGYGLRWGLVWSSLAFLIAGTAAVLAYGRRRYLPVGWFWFLGNMVPMMGLIQIDLPAYADRWAYTGFIGIYLMVCWSAADWAEKHRARTLALRLAAGAVLLALALLTRHQTGFWKDDLTVWMHSADVNAGNLIAHTYIARILQSHGQYDEALEYLYRAAEDAPLDYETWANIAFAEHRRRNLPEAIRYYQKALAMAGSKDKDTRAQLWANLGHAYSDMGDTARARECFQTYLRVRNEQQP